MLSPDIPNRIPADTWWAFDNACFAHPGKFNWQRWEKELSKRLLESPDRCLFVVAPDVPFDAEGTVNRFSEYRDQLLALNVPLAFVTQDGMGTEDVPWGDIAALFVGGSTAWKTGHESGEIITAGRQRGKLAHMGRVNSLRRLNHAKSLGCDSADGTFLKFGPDINWKRLTNWMDTMEMNPIMALPH